MALKLKLYGNPPKGLDLPSEFKKGDEGSLVVSLKLDVSSMAAELAKANRAKLAEPVYAHVVAVVSEYDLGQLLDEGKLVAAHGRVERVEDSVSDVPAAVPHEDSLD